MLKSDDFLAPRNCFLTPIPELDEAADLLGRAADALLTGNLGLAGDLTRQADMPAIRVYAARVMGRITEDIHRYRAIAGVSGSVGSLDRAKDRRPKPLAELAVFARDGYRCRYCGCRVLLSKARSIMKSAVPEALQWGAADPNNLLTTCQSCNYGKGDWLIDEVGLIDPRMRPPVCDSWDGLARLLSYSGQTSKRGHDDPADKSKRAGKRPSEAMRDGGPAESASRENWFSALDRCHPHLSTRLLEFLESCADLGVTWSLKEVLLIRMSARGIVLAILGIDRDAEVEIPWHIAGHKENSTLSPTRSQTRSQEPWLMRRQRLWRVKKEGKNLKLPELLDWSSALRLALERLHAALMD